jgi:maleate isomerase
LGGYAEDVALCDKLSSRVGAPVRTASLAIVEALQALHCERITLLSPYPDWLTQQSKHYWESAGIEVKQVASITNAASPDAHVYALGSDDVAAAIARLPADAGTVLMTGTGLMSLPTMLAATQSSSSPLLLSSNLCGAWWLSREMEMAPSASLASANPTLSTLAVR